MDNIVILDKLDEFSVRFDGKIGQIETKLDGLGQNISNVSNDTELLTGQQDYIFVPQVISFPAYVVCNSAIGEFKVNANSGNGTGWHYLYKFKPKIRGEVKILFKGTTNSTTIRSSRSNYVIRNLTNGSNILDQKLYANLDDDSNNFSFESNIPLLKDNEYAIAIKNTNSSFSQTVNITVCNIYTATKITTQTIPNQIVEIN